MKPVDIDPRSLVLNKIPKEVPVQYLLIMGEQQVSDLEKFLATPNVNVLSTELFTKAQAALRKLKRQSSSSRISSP